ncbi:hypothetical protein ACXR0O_26735 [Verrucomicrobiota bacterium sgz303538]
MFSRRNFLQTATLAALAPDIRAQDLPKLPPVRAITKGSKFHWFGYYDKFQFDPTNRFVLGNQVDFENRSPTADDKIKVGMVDLQDGDKWIELGETRAWNWQQGCMLQWLPGVESEVMWNDREGDQFVCRILDVKSGKKRTLPHPVYTVSPDGRWGLAPDFRRLNDTRPGYGYTGIPDPNREHLAPSDAGIWKIDMQTGQAKLLITFAEIAEVPFDADPSEFDGAKHWFNHLLFNTDGSRFLWLHRWRGTNAAQKYGGVGGFGTRMFTASADGTDRYILDPLGRTSHFVWRDPHHVFAWAYHPSFKDRFYLFTDKTREVHAVGPELMVVNGHNTYLPGKNNEWVLNDTYPDKNGLQNVYLYHIPSNRRVPIGSFESKPPYRGEWRCDTHPRSSRDGKLVCIDSPHAGGRQMYLINISEIVS